MSTLQDPSIYDIQQRTPIAAWQTVDVTFPVANTDTVVPHGLNSTAVRFLVVDKNAAGDVFRGVKASTTAYIVLQATTPGTYHIQLHVELTHRSLTA